MTIKKAKKEIEGFIETPGEYGHNIISATLRIIARDYGYGEANKLVKDLDLTNHFSIKSYWPSIDILKDKPMVDKFMGPTVSKYHPTREYGTKSI